MQNTNMIDDSAPGGQPFIVGLAALAHNAQRATVQDFLNIVEQHRKLLLEYPRFVVHEPESFDSFKYGSGIYRARWDGDEVVKFNHPPLNFSSPLTVARGSTWLFAWFPTYDECAVHHEILFDLNNAPNYLWIRKYVSGHQPSNWYQMAPTAHLGDVTLDDIQQMMERYSL